MAWLVDPGNPDTSSFAVAAIDDGSPLDALASLFGLASVFEQVQIADPSPSAAADIAADRLRALRGATHTLTIKCVPQPWLEPGDIILIDFQGTKVHAQVVGWSMDAGQFTDMSVTVRAWQVVTDLDLPAAPGWPLGSETINGAVLPGVDRPHVMPIDQQGMF